MWKNEKGASLIKKIIGRLIIILFMTIIIISSYILIRDFTKFKESDNANKELVNTVITQNKENEEVEVKIDWNKLKEINKDIIGWIKINNTNINYPILQDDDSLKYIQHSFDGKYNSNGSIFTLNKNPFDDNVTVIYGHNMKTRIMFSELDRYMDKNFFYEHQTFEIYTLNQNYEAKVFSCYSIGVDEEENNIKSLSFQEEIEYYKKISKFKVDKIDEIKKIIKLSTCSYLNKHTTPTNQRYYIVATLKKVD